MLTGSRGGTLSLMIVVASLAALSASSLSGAARRRRLRVAALVAGAFVLVGAGIAGLAIMRLGDDPTGRAAGAPPGLSVALRSVSWQKAVLLAAHHPVTGVGPGRFADALIAMDNPAPEKIPAAEFVRHVSENAHNSLLQVTAELGFPGLACYLALFLLALAVLHRVAAGARTFPGQGLTQGLLAGQAALLALAMVSHPFLLAEIQGTYWLLAMVAIGSGRLEKPHGLGLGESKTGS